MAAATFAVLAASVFQLAVQATLAVSSHSVPSDFFEDASATLSRSSGEVSGAPYDVGNNAVPLPTELESPHPWKVEQDSAFASSSKLGSLSLVAASTATSASTASAASASTGPARGDDVNEDASPQQQQQQQRQEVLKLLQQQEQQRQDQMAQQEQQRKQQQEQQELQRKLQENEGLRLQQAQQQQAQAQALLQQQQQQQLQQQRQQQQLQQQQQQQQQQLQQQQQQQQQLQQQQQQQQRLQEQRLQELQQRRQQQEQASKQATTSAAKAEDPAVEAASFFEAQGDLAGKDPLSFSEVATPDAALSLAAPSLDDKALLSGEKEKAPDATGVPMMAQVSSLAQEQKSISADGTAVSAAAPTAAADAQQPKAAPLSSSLVEQELAKLHQQQRYLEMLSQSLIQNMSQAQAPSAAAQPAPPLVQQAAPAVVQQVAPAVQASSYASSDPLSGSAQERGVGFAQRNEEEFAPRHEDCTPRCSYKCTNPICEEECQPHCDSPRCQTRCTGTELSGCRMQCGQPHCSVVCPTKMCSGPDCQQCTTKCSEPMCMLQCPKAQPCHNVCEQPRCLWKCKAPTTCPKPKCDMVCESPKACTGSTYKELPPLKTGELSVMSFQAPAELLAGSLAGSDSVATTPTPLAQPQVRPSFLEHAAATTALRGAYGSMQQQQQYAQPQRYSPSSSMLHVPVESVPADGSLFGRTPWLANMGGQRSSQPTQQWTARMPATLARGGKDDYLTQSSQSYLSQDTLGASENLYGY